MTKLVWVHGGDSISATISSWFYKTLNSPSKGDGGVPQLQAACTYYSGDIIARNMAITGTALNTSGYPDFVSLAPIDIDPIYAVKSVSGSGGATSATGRKYLVSSAIGSNDAVLGGHATVTQYAAAHAVALRARRTAGADLLSITTILPRGDGFLLEANRLAYNALISSPAWLAANSIDFCLDLASQAIMGDPSTLGNATYWLGDQVHPTDAGQLLLVPIVQAWLSTIQAGI